jgi:hypothetical protein
LKVAKIRKAILSMDGDGAEIHELRPRTKCRPTEIRDRWTRVEPETAREEEERINQRALKRILETEVHHSLPALEQAALEAERGRRLHAMAGLAGDPDRERELAAALNRLAATAWLPE